MLPTVVSYIPGSLGTIDAVLGVSLAVLVLAGEIVGFAWSRGSKTSLASEERKRFRFHFL